MPSLSLVAPPVSGIDLVQLSYLAWLESQDNERAIKYGLFRRYYEGDHDSQLTARMRKFLKLTDDQEFTLNACPIVVDSLAEKLKVAGFDCDNKPDILREWWRRSRMDAVQAVVHTAAIRDGDTYVLVEWSNDHKRPMFTQENAYDGSQGLHVVYSDERRNVPVVAIKRWILTSGVNIKTRRTNLYYPDRIEKYSDMGTGQTWQEYVDTEGQYAGVWPIPWTRSGEPLGIPVIHFRNKDQGYSYGESELEDPVPLQNGLTKTLIDLLAAADTTGFQMLTATGVDKAPDIVAPGMTLWSTNPAASYGSISAADLSGLIALKDSIMADIAKITRTPLSYFQMTGQVAAAGTLKEQRSGLISKALDRQTTFGNSWEDVMYMARKLHNTFGSGGMDEEAEITCDFADDEKPDDNELAAQADMLFKSQSASVATRVKLIHPDWDEKAILEEIDLIREEQAMNVPEIPFATAGEVQNGGSAVQGNAEGQAAQA